MAGLFGKKKSRYWKYFRAYCRSWSSIRLRITDNFNELSLNGEVDSVAIIYLRTLLVGIMLTLLTKVLNLDVNFMGKSRKTLVILSVGGFFGIGFRVIMLLNAITYLGADKASFIASASPVVSTSLAIALLREKFRVRMVLAAILVLPKLLC